MKKLLWLVLAIITILFVGGKIYTDIVVQRSELKYPPENFISVENMRLHYAEAGTGQTVIIITGGSGKTQDFSLSPLYKLAVEKYRVIIFDRPGLGYSEKPLDEETTPEVQARLIHTAITEMGIENPIIVGQSWGGVIALAYAQTYSDELSGIVLIGTAPYPRERNTNFFYGIARTPIIGDIVLHTLYVPIGRLWIAPAMMEQNKEDFSPLDAVPETYYDSTLELGLRPSHVKTSAEETLTIPASLETLVSGLDQVDVPVIIIAGDQDTHAFEQALRLEQDLPASKTIVVEGANHYLWFGNPEIVMEAIQELWQWSEEFIESK